MVGGVDIVMNIVLLIMFFVGVGLPLIAISVTCAFMIYNDYKTRKFLEKWYNDK